MEEKSPLIRYVEAFNTLPPSIIQKALTGHPWANLSPEERIEVVKKAATKQKP